MTHPSPLSPVSPMIEVTDLISHVTSSVSHTQKNTYCPTVSASVSPRHPSGCHRLPSPPPRKAVSRAAAPCQGCFLLLCSMFSATACSQGFPVVRAPARTGPAWDTGPKAPELAKGTLGPSAPHSGGTHGISPHSVSPAQSQLELPCSQLVLAPPKGPPRPAPLSECPGPCFLGGAPMGSLEEADYTV